MPTDEDSGPGSGTKVHLAALQERVQAVSEKVDDLDGWMGKLDQSHTRHKEYVATISSGLEQAMVGVKGELRVIRWIGLTVAGACITVATSCVIAVIFYAVRTQLKGTP